MFGALSTLDGTRAIGTSVRDAGCSRPLRAAASGAFREPAGFHQSLRRTKRTVTSRVRFTDWETPLKRFAFTSTVLTALLLPARAAQAEQVPPAPSACGRAEEPLGAAYPHCKAAEEACVEGSVNDCANLLIGGEED